MFESALHQSRFTRSSLPFVPQKAMMRVQVLWIAPPDILQPSKQPMADATIGCMDTRVVVVHIVDFQCLHEVHWLVARFRALLMVVTVADILVLDIHVTIMYPIITLRNTTVLVRVVFALNLNRGLSAFVRRDT